MPSDERSRKLLDAIAALPLGETRIMEVCGTHTMAIAKSGIRSPAVCCPRTFTCFPGRAALSVSRYRKTSTPYWSSPWNRTSS